MSPQSQPSAAPKAQDARTGDDERRVQGEFTLVDGQAFYRIRDYDLMAPFFLTVVSDSDHWMFVSSNGGLTAGRRNSGHSLFPYYTEDKIHDTAEVTGPRTLLRVSRDGETSLWEPFSERLRGIHRVRRNLYKGGFGNQVIFEEINVDLGLAFRYKWAYSDAYGLVRESRLENLSKRILKVEVVDGVQNLLPAGVSPDFQNLFSNLGDAYKKSELEGVLGIYSFSSIPGDKAEPMESLKANTCFSLGLEKPVILLSSRQLDAFRAGRAVKAEVDIRGGRGAYFVNAAFDLEPESSERWTLVAEVDQGPSDVADLLRELAAGGVAEKVEADVRAGTARLKRIVGSADGIQKTRDAMGANHHFANCLFNVMRGGVFQEGYAIDARDLKAFVKKANQEAWKAHAARLEALPATLSLEELRGRVAEAADPRLERIVSEYLPLSFSRRHGDPSRPWNIFNIELKDAHGNRVLAYQGNWRDIFQNWEALGLSFPEFAEGFIFRFLDATTADGYNPYRITKHGFDWEKPHADEPWANIGYWGDHQLIYLLRLLELSDKVHPGRLEGYLSKNLFAYADVPYDIKPYADLVKDPRNTIEYNKAREKRIQERVDRLGTDGQYVADAQGAVHAVNLAEKLLVPLLAKVSNFIPGAGIWLNTQRPEWNDANNALAGYGLSMVTAYYARRYAAFLKGLLVRSGSAKLSLSSEVATWFRSSLSALQAAGPKCAGTPASKALVDALGRAASDYRAGLYTRSLSGDRVEVEAAAFAAFLDAVLALIDDAVARNRRPDGLYHAYNVFDPATLEVRTLYEMLEGQVAVLSSGALSPREAISVLEALRKSRMYRADQHSYLLYPDKELPRFTAKNNLPASALEGSALLRKLVADGEVSLVERDSAGGLHYAGGLKNAGDVRAALEKLAKEGYADLVAAEADAVVAQYEKNFDHQSFTGRSGTFFGYEGLGCIYWHMVSKLLLAVQENFQAAADAGDREAAAKLREIYYDVRAGIGFNKTPDVYGAFPADPYSHTPAGAGAKQPGMTGQVKEEVITRLGELGVRMRAGSIAIEPVLLRQSEFLAEPSELEYVDVDGALKKAALPAGSLGFTLCQVPVVYHQADHAALKVAYRDGKTAESASLSLDASACRDLYTRSGRIARIDAFIPRSLLA